MIGRLLCLPGGREYMRWETRAGLLGVFVPLFHRLRELMVDALERLEFLCKVRSKLGLVARG